jgi:hypothetical protein
MSGFTYETDATCIQHQQFDTLKLPLSIVAGIDSYGKTFPVAYCYITSEPAASFKFVADQLSDIAFNNCQKPQSSLEIFLKAWELHAQPKLLR